MWPTQPPGPPQGGRSREELARIFTWFGEVECPAVGGWLYRALCRRIAGDEALLALAARAPASQPPPNLLFAAAHAVLLDGEPHPLRAWYPALSGEPAPDPEAAFPAFRDLCLRHRARVERAVATRGVQTQVVERCAPLLPAWARMAAAADGRPLACLELGASAGLNLLWDRHRYVYTRPDRGKPVASWGDPAAAVTLPCALRGGASPSLPPEDLRAVWRRGVDLAPIDVRDPAAVTWLRALVWPEHVERQARLAAALALARRSPPRVEPGDASDCIRELLDAPPREAWLCVFATHTLYQWPRASRVGTLRAMQAASRRRPIDFVSMEGTGHGFSELYATRYRNGERETRRLARCSAHGHWLEWLGPP